MGAKKPCLIVALAVLAVFTATGLAGAPMGPPIAVLGEGRWGIGAEYGYEMMDLEAFGIISEVRLGPLDPAAEILEVRDLTTNMIFGSLAYGICDNWDIFARAGVADAQDEVVVSARSGGTPGEMSTYEGSFGFAWGAGTRATFCRSGPWSFGGLVQATWFTPGESDWASQNPAVPSEVAVGTAELDYWQTQVSLAAVYQVDSSHLWVGPFLQFVEGNLDRSGDIVDGGTPVGTFSASSDVEEASQIGAHAGFHWQVAKDFDFWIEGQYTADSWLASVSVVLIPQPAAQGK
jgi:hypothetical protein